MADLRRGVPSTAPRWSRFQSRAVGAADTMLPDEQLGQANGVARHRPRGAAPGRHRSPAPALYAGFGGPAVAVLDAGDLPGLGRRAAGPAGRRADAGPLRAALPRRGQRRRPAPARHTRCCARTVVATVICMLAHRHQRVGLLRRRRRGARQAGRVRRACSARSRASARSSAGVHHHGADPAHRRAAAGRLGVRPDRRRCPCSRCRRTLPVVGRRQLLVRRRAAGARSSASRR